MPTHKQMIVGSRKPRQPAHDNTNNELRLGTDRKMRNAELFETFGRNGLTLDICIVISVANRKFCVAGHPSGNDRLAYLRLQTWLRYGSMHDASNRIRLSPVVELG